MADTVIENLITKLSFDIDSEGADIFNKITDMFVITLGDIIDLAGKAVDGMKSLTSSIAEANDQLGKFAERTGIDVAALQELGYVAELNGGSVDSMSGSLENLLKIASEASRGMGGGVEAFGMLGISVTGANGRLKDADDLLLDVADSISRLRTQAERLEFSSKLGIGSDLLIAVQQGSAAIREQRQEARELGFILDKDATTAAAAFNDEMLRIDRIIKGVASAIGTRLMKHMIPMHKAFISWFKTNKKIIQQNITAFLDGLLKVMRGLWNIGVRVASVVTALVRAMGGWKSSIIAVTGLMMTLNASTLLMPILAIAAGLGLLLILDEIRVFAQDGDSALGDLIKRFPKLEKPVRLLLKLMGMVVEGWKLIFTHGGDALDGLSQMVDDLRAKFWLLDAVIRTVGTSLSLWKDAIKLQFKLIGDLITALPDVWDSFLVKGTAAIDKLIGAFDSLKSSAADFLLAPINKTLELLNRIPFINLGAIEGAATSGALMQQGRSGDTSTTVNGGASSNSTTNAPTINININGGNTDKIRQVISETLSQQYSGAQTNLSSNVEW